MRVCILYKPIIYIVILIYSQDKKQSIIMSFGNTRNYKIPFIIKKKIYSCIIHFIIQ